MLAISVAGTSVSIPKAQAGEIVVAAMPAPGTMVDLSPSYSPAYLKGIIIHPDNALQFDFLINQGEGALNEKQKHREYNKLVKFFLASLTVPDEDQWVNLSPYEKNRIIPEDFGKTEMGRDLLAQDYLLKQITSSLIYPEKGLGKAFWDKVYAQAYARYGHTNIPVSTFNKVWIVPEKAVVYEKGNTAYVVENHLKVMLEQDYLAVANKPLNVRATEGTNRSTLAQDVIREIVIPALEREVNQGKNFALLRQAYSAMILAAWYKRALKQSLLGKIYADKNKVAGIVSLQGAQGPEVIYQKYLEAFKKGVYNYIKEDTDIYTREVIPRKYFSGGAVGYSADYAQIVKTIDHLNEVQRAEIAGQMAATDIAQVDIRPAVPQVSPDLRTKLASSNAKMRERRDRYGKAYSEHIQNSRKFILEGAQGLKGTALLVGVGNGTEYTLEGLEALAKQFDHLIAVDIDAETVENTLSGLEPSLRAKFEIKEEDLSGILADFSSRADQIVNAAATATQALEEISTLLDEEAQRVKGVETSQYQASYVVSSLLMSQLGAFVNDYVIDIFKRKFQVEPSGELYNQSMGRLTFQLDIKHMAALYTWVGPGGRVYLSDTTAILNTKERMIRSPQVIESTEVFGPYLLKALDILFDTQVTRTWTWHHIPPVGDIKGSAFKVEAFLLSAKEDAAMGSFQLPKEVGYEIQPGRILINDEIAQVLHGQRKQQVVEEGAFYIIGGFDEAHKAAILKAIEKFTSGVQAGQIMDVLTKPGTIIIPQEWFRDEQRPFVEDILAHFEHEKLWDELEAGNSEDIALLKRKFEDLLEAGRKVPVNIRGFKNRTNLFLGGLVSLGYDELSAVEFWTDYADRLKTHSSKAYIDEFLRRVFEHNRALQADMQSTFALISQQREKAQAQAKQVMQRIIQKQNAQLVRLDRLIPRLEEIWQEPNARSQAFWVDAHMLPMDMEGMFSNFYIDLGDQRRINLVDIIEEYWAGVVFNLSGAPLEGMDEDTLVVNLKEPKDEKAVKAQFIDILDAILDKLLQKLARARPQKQRQIQQDADLLHTSWHLVFYNSNPGFTTYRIELPTKVYTSRLSSVGLLDMLREDFQDRAQVAVDFEEKIAEVKEKLTKLRKTSDIVRVLMGLERYAMAKGLMEKMVDDDPGDDIYAQLNRILIPKRIVIERDYEDTGILIYKILRTDSYQGEQGAIHQYLGKLLNAGIRGKRGTHGGNAFTGTFLPYGIHSRDQLNWIAGSYSRIVIRKAELPVPELPGQDRDFANELSRLSTVFLRKAFAGKRPSEILEDILANDTVFNLAQQARRERGVNFKNIYEGKELILAYLYTLSNSPALFYGLYFDVFTAALNATSIGFSVLSILAGSTDKKEILAWLRDQAQDPDAEHTVRRRARDAYFLLAKEDPVLYFEKITADSTSTQVPEETKDGRPGEGLSAPAPKTFAWSYYLRLSSINWRRLFERKQKVVLVAQEEEQAPVPAPAAAQPEEIFAEVAPGDLKVSVENFETEKMESEGIFADREWIEDLIVKVKDGEEDPYQTIIDNIVHLINAEDRTDLSLGKLQGLILEVMKNIDYLKGYSSFRAYFNSVGRKVSRDAPAPAAQPSQAFEFELHVLKNSAYINDSRDINATDVRSRIGRFLERYNFVEKGGPRSALDAYNQRGFSKIFRVKLRENWSAYVRVFGNNTALLVAFENRSRTHKGHILDENFRTYASQYDGDHVGDFEDLRAAVNQLESITVDAAMGPAGKESNVGGIDFNAANLDLQIKGKGAALPLAQQDLAQLSQIPGFVPHIIAIKPAGNLAEIF